MANPQAENGYTRIANEILDEILRRDFTERELKIIFCVIRNTYGWNRKMHQMSLNYIARATGMNRANVSRSRSSLLASRVLVSDNDKYGIQKDYTRWGVLPKQQQGCCQIGKSGVAKSAPNKYKINKDRINKDTKAKSNNEKQNLTAIFGRSN